MFIRTFLRTAKVEWEFRMQDVFIFAHLLTVSFYMTQSHFTVFCTTKTNQHDAIYRYEKIKSYDTNFKCISSIKNSFKYIFRLWRTRYKYSTDKIHNEVFLVTLIFYLRYYCFWPFKLYCIFFFVLSVYLYIPAAVFLMYHTIPVSR